MDIETKIKETKEKISVLLPDYIEKFDKLEVYKSDNNVLLIKTVLFLYDDYNMLFEQMLTQTEIEGLTRKQKIELYKIFSDLMDFIKDLKV
jgi:hypothetical protein